MSLEREKIRLAIQEIAYEEGKRKEVFIIIGGGGISTYFSIPLSQALEVQGALGEVIEKVRAFEEGKKPCE